MYVTYTEAKFLKLHYLVDTFRKQMTCPSFSTNTLISEIEML